MPAACSKCGDPATTALDLVVPLTNGVEITVYFCPSCRTSRDVLPTAAAYKRRGFSWCGGTWIRPDLVDRSSSIQLDAAEEHAWWSKVRK